MFKNQRFRNIVGNLCTTSRDLDRYSSCNSCDTKTLCYSDYRPLCHYCAMLQRAINNLEINNYIVSANSYCFKNNIWNPDMKTSILSNSVNILHTKIKKFLELESPTCHATTSYRILDRDSLQSQIFSIHTFSYSKSLDVDLTTHILCR